MSADDRRKKNSPVTKDELNVAPQVTGCTGHLGPNVPGVHKRLHSTISPSIPHRSPLANARAAGSAPEVKVPRAAHGHLVGAVCRAANEVREESALSESRTQACVTIHPYNRGTHLNVAIRRREKHRVGPSTIAGAPSTGTEKAIGTHNAHTTNSAHHSATEC